VVGNILIPIAGVEHAPVEVSWFFFSIGFVFWIALFVIFFYRIVFHHPLAEKLLPTLFILISPPAVGFISLLKLGGVNDFARILYYFALFLLLLLMSQFRLFTKIRFYLSWWAYSFPLAALTIATLALFQASQNQAFLGIGLGIGALLGVLVAVLLVRTLMAVVRKQICVAED